MWRQVSPSTTSANDHYKEYNQIQFQKDIEKPWPRFKMTIFQSMGKKPDALSVEE